MSAWLSQHAQAFRSALRKLANQRASSLLNVLVIGIALALPAGGYVLLGNIQAVAARFSLEPQLSIFLGAEAKPADRDGLEKALRADARVGAIRFVSKEAALAELSKTEGVAEVAAALGRNPLPDSLVVRLRENRPQELEALAADMRKRLGVGHVQADTGWARRLAALIEIGRMGIVFFGLLLSTGMIAVTFNTIRLQVLMQREEIEVARLLGASDSFIRRPFYYVGALQGLGGGGIGLAILGAGHFLLNRGVRALSETYGSTFELSFLAMGDALAVTTFASVLGWLGAYLSVSIHLREIEPR